MAGVREELYRAYEDSDKNSFEDFITDILEVIERQTFDLMLEVAWGLPDERRKVCSRALTQELDKLSDTRDKLTGSGG